MKSAEAFIERREISSVVDLEIFVVQVMGVLLEIELEPSIEHDRMKATMTRCRRQCGELQMKQHVYRMRWNDPMHQDGREVQDVLHGMHRQTRPWARIAVFVMKAVHRGIEWAPVNQPVDK